MDGGQNRPAPGQGQSQASLIRPEQVSRLPQLTQPQKINYTDGVRRFWDVLNNNPQGSEAYTLAYNKLVQTSQQLMAGMKNYQQQVKQRQTQQQQAQQAQAQAQAQAHAQAQAQAQSQSQAQVSAPGAQQQGQTQTSSVQFSQLMPEIQQRVNEQHFYYPPAMMEGTQQAETWLREAKARFGQALQRLQVARSKKADFNRQAQQRNQAGNPLNAQENEVFQNKVAQCNKAINESQNFMEKFKQQQNEFKTQQPHHQYTKQQTSSADQAQTSVTTMQTGGPASQQGPHAHSISSAVSAATAARNQQQQAQTAQSGQAGTAGSPTAPTAPSQTPIKTEVTSGPVFNATTMPEIPTPTGPRPSTAQSIPPSALSQHPSQSNVHALNASINGARPNTAQSITKNLQVTEPKPVNMPPSRPTLNGGAGVGLPGQLGQPALTTLPGYVLESSEDGRLLSKKKLSELVREVCGPGPDEQLTSEAEEIFLQLADDFVDDLVTAACKLAKLRNSATLEARDLQMVLERQYNIRVPGFSTDEVRTVKKVQPAQGWAQKMSAVQAAKLTGGSGKD